MFSSMTTSEELRSGGLSAASSTPDSVWVRLEPQLLIEADHCREQQMCSDPLAMAQRFSQTIMPGYLDKETSHIPSVSANRQMFPICSDFSASTVLTTMYRPMPFPCAQSMRLRSLHSL